MHAPDGLDARITAAHERFLRAVAGIDDRTLEHEQAVGIWTPRDVAAHLADWAEEIMAAAKCCLGGPKPEHHPIEDNQRYNTEHAAMHTDQSWEETILHLDTMMAECAVLAEPLTPEQLDSQTYLPWGGTGTLRRLLMGIVNHHDEHTEQIESWRSARG